MSNRAAAWLAWALCGLITCLAVVLFGADLLRQAGSYTVVQLAGDALLSLAMPVGFALVAALIVSRQPRNTIGWLLMVPVGVLLVGEPIEEYLQRLAPSSPAPTLLLLLMVWFSNWSWLLLIVPLLHIPLLFPNGQPPTPRWRWVSVAAIAWATLFVLLATVSRTLSTGTTPDLVLDNPIGVLSHDMVELLASVWIAGLLALVVLCVGALFVRYRRAHATERAQIKWLLSACAMFLIVYVGGTVSGVAGTASLAGSLWQAFFGLSLVAVPAAIGMAILRYRLYEIDVIVRRTLIYGLLSGLLATLYLALVVVLQGLFRALAGQESNLAIVVATLTSAAVFQPLRGRIQAVINRRFYRRTYDAAATLAAFTAHLRDEVDLTTLSEELVRVVDETIQPSHVSLWLRMPPRASASPAAEHGDADGNTLAR